MFDLSISKPRSFGNFYLGDFSKRLRPGFVFAAAAYSFVSSHACSAQTGYDEWYSQATAATTSPVVASASDLTRNWTAPDGRTITARVREPVDNGISVTLVQPPSGADARPYFDQMVTAAIKVHASHLVIPPGTYVFKTQSGGTTAHWQIRRLSDATIEGNGATLVFNLNLAGIAVTECQRLKLANLTIDYALHTTSFAHMLAAPGGQLGILQVDAGTTVTQADGIGHIEDYNKSTLTPEPDDIRVYPKSVKYIGNGQYASGAFTKYTIGKEYLIYHHNYGGTAIKLQGDPYSGAKQTEDITLDGVSIVRSPGMGIVVSGVKRGVAIINSKIAPAPGEAASSEYDAVHVFLPGGDLLIRGNTIAGAGDDNINLDSPVTPVVKSDTAGTTLTVGTWSYFYRPGDTVFAFDGDFKLLGSAKVVTVPAAPGGGNNAIKIDKAIPGLNTSSQLRDVSLSNSRVAVESNSFTNGGKVLVQVANVLVAKNEFVNSGIRVLSNVGPFDEGMGGLNVLIDGNIISGGKITTRYNFPFAAISAYGLNQGSLITKQPVNNYLAITNNRITGVPQACISVASTVHSYVANNICLHANTATPGGFDINLVNDVDVTMSENTLSAEFPLLAINDVQVH